MERIGAEKAIWHLSKGNRTTKEKENKTEHELGHREGSQ